MSGIVFKLRVISSPSSPFPLDNPLTSLPDSYVREADIPSILGSALYSNSKLLLRFKKFTIYQDNLGIKVGTDSIILGSWIKIKINTSIFLMLVQVMV